MQYCILYVCMRACARSIKFSISVLNWNKISCRSVSFTLFRQW